MREATLGSLFQDRSNNFDFLRALLAVLVIFSHSYALLDSSSIRDPLYLATHRQMGFSYIAVNLFFVISGFLITASWMRSRSTGDYLLKRALRIYPAFAVMSLFCLLVIGPLSVDDARSYLRSLSVSQYFTRLLRFRLPDQAGVFANLPEAGMVNGSTWTILYEFICYILVLALGILGVLSRRALVVGLFAAAFSSYIWQEYRGLPLLSGGGGLGGLLLSPAYPRFLTYFLSGAVFYLYRDVIPHSRWAFALASVATLVSFAGGLTLTLPIFGSYLLLHTAFNRSLKLQGFARRGDLSYGLYLYAFPVQQILIQYYGEHLGPLSLTIAATALATILAALSWHLVEAPFLRLKTSAR
jgi:peptidoglycan/LPS O-acetylase OafA/YrhL